MDSKREVPEIVKTLLALDIAVSNKTCHLINKVVKLDSVKGFLNALEVSCHGILWIAFWLIYIWLFWNPELFEMQVNFFLALIVDILCVAVMKSFFRRRRPSGHVSKSQSMWPDAYSFPSGHVSRSFMVYLFFTHLFPVGMFWSAIILAWSVNVAASRLLLRKHYLLDIAGGFLLAFIDFYLISWLWISKSNCVWLIEFITDEKSDVGE